MHWSDRLVAAISPRWAARRVASRRALRFIEAASSNSTDFGRNTGRVADALPTRVVARQRVRNLLATNPFARKAMNALLNNMIGFGITGTPKKGTPAKLVKAWKKWIKKADWLSHLDFYGLQELTVAAMLGDGDVFIIRRFEAGSGTVPLRLEVLDGGMLALEKGEQGISYDERGRPASYHFRKHRAGGLALSSNETVSFAAAEVIHLFRKDWPGQTRGRSMFESVIKRFEDLDAYFEAEVVRKQIEACFAAFITPSLEAGDLDLGNRDGTTTNNGFDQETLEPGMMARLNPGDTVTFGTPRVTVGMAEFSRVTLLSSSAGVGVTYEHGSGDLSNVNYSSYRAGKLEFERFCGRLQWLLIVPVMLERIWEWFLDDAYSVGIASSRDYEIDWTPPSFGSVDEEKETRAAVARMESGLSSRRKEIAARGEDHDETLAEIAADLEAQKTLKLGFAGDPRAPQQQQTGDANAAVQAAA